MNINYKQTQFELFPGQSSESSPESKPKILLSNVSLNFENIIVLTVIFFMAIILFFSLGVERGKRVYQRSLEQKDAITQMAQETPVSIPETKPAVHMAAESMEVAKDFSAEDPGVYIETMATDFYTVQVASFKTKEYAEKEAQALRAKGYEVFIVPKGNHMIVCAGKFLERKEANGFSIKLRDQYKDCLVRRL